MPPDTHARHLARWLLAGGGLLLPLFASPHAHGIICDVTDQESLELEIQSVERGGETVDDLSPWKRADGEDVETVLVATAEGEVALWTETSEDDKSVSFTKSK